MQFKKILRHKKKVYFKFVFHIYCNILERMILNGPYLNKIEIDQRRVTMSTIKDFVKLRIMYLTGLTILGCCMIFLSSDSSVFAFEGQLKWKYQISIYLGTYGTSPAIGSDGCIYVGSNAGNLYAINSNGTLRWKYPMIYSPTTSSPTIGSDGTIYFGLGGDPYVHDNYIYAINGDGTLKWRYKTRYALHSSAAIGSDGTIYVANDSLYAFKPDGTLLWTYSKSLPGWPIVQSPSIGDDGTIYFGEPESNYFYAIKPDGTLKWRNEPSGPSDSSPAIGFDGTIYYTSLEGNYFLGNRTYLYAVNPDSTIKWKYWPGTLGYNGHSSPTIGTDGTIYMGMDSGQLIAIKSDGTLKWRYQTGGVIDWSSPTVGSDGTVYIGSKDNFLYAINSDGTLKWSYQTAGLRGLNSSPVISSDGTIYIRDDIYLYAIDSGVGTGLANSSWPMFGRTPDHQRRWAPLKPSFDAISPNNVKNAGIVDVKIFGLGFKQGAAVKLTKSGYRDIAGIETTVVDSTKITSKFELTGRQLGEWDVVIKNPDGLTLTLPKGLKIDVGYVNLWVDVMGRNQFHWGREQKYSINVGNSGNVSLSRALIRVQVKNAILDSPCENAFEDSTAPFSGSGFIFIVLDLLPGSVRTIPIIAKAPHIGIVELTVEAMKAEGAVATVQTAPKLQTAKISNSYGVERILDNKFDTIQLTKYPTIEITKKSDKPENGSVIYCTGPVGHKAFVVYDINGMPYVYENLPDWPKQSDLRTYYQDRGYPQNGTRKTSWDDFVIRYIVEKERIFVHQLPLTDKQKEKAWEYSDSLSKPSNREPYKLFSIKCTESVDWLLNYIEFPSQPYRDVFTTPQENFTDLGGIIPKEVIIDEYKTYCDSQRNPLLFQNNFDLISSKDVLVVQAVDPNEKVGPIGFGSNRSLLLDELLQYLIYFENKDSATAAAEEVTVIDTLSTNLDWSTLVLGEIQIGDHTITAPSTGQSFNTKIAWNDTTKLQVTSTFDSATGAVRWYLKATDPRTGDFAGFLPPNKIPPKGEGHVSFTIKAIKGIISGAEIKNRASIIFDVNPPMQTNEVFNTIDALPPNSSVTSVVVSEKPLQLNVKWAGKDDTGGSGIKGYSIFTSDDGGPYKSWISNTSETSGIFTPQAGHVYRFYSISQDSVGNIEVQPDSVDMTIGPIIPTGVKEQDTPKVFSLSQNYPNPFNPVTTIKYQLPKSAAVSLKIYNVLGQPIKTLVDGKQSPGYYTIRWDSRDNSGRLVGNGIYFYNIKAGELVLTKKALILK
jgi:outer membrane protein assembly factor BamB